MALTKFTASTAIIAALADLPNATSGLTAAQLKAKFDENPEAFKVFVNNLIDQLESTASGISGADQIGSSAILGVTGTTVGAQLADLKTQLNSIIAEEIIPSSVVDDMLSDIPGQIKDRVNEKADITYVDTEIAAVASGSPKGVYATLVDLEAAFPTGDTNIYLVTADGEWYYWDSSSWTAGGTYQSTGIADESVTPEKTSFITNVSGNLFNKSTIIDGYLVYQVDGTLVANAAHFASDYIAVTPSTVYRYDLAYEGSEHKTLYNAYRFFRVSYYDEDKVFIQGFDSSAQTARTTTSGTYFIRVSANVSGDGITAGDTKQSLINDMMIYEGVGLRISYIPFFIGQLNSVNLLARWKGKNLCSYGDSITEAGLWQPYVVDYFEFGVHSNQGHSGEQLYWLGSGTVGDAYIAEIPTDTDVILVMGGTNDFAQNLDLVNFKAGIKAIITKLQVAIPNVTIVFMSPLSGRGQSAGVNMTDFVYNSLGLSTVDYAIAMQEECQRHSIPFIDVYGLTGINQFNRATYISDTVHPNAAGAEKIAQVAISGLKSIHPNF